MYLILLAALTPILGIPVPSFGIVEQAGSFTHYVDNTDPNATNSNNPNGSIATPRLTIPLIVPAGSVVEVHGGPYFGPPRQLNLSGIGTLTSPIFYHGIDNPVLEGREILISGAYIVFEGFKVHQGKVRMYGATVNHIAVRDNEVYDQLPAPGGCAVCVVGSDIVVKHNLMHNNGDPNYFDENDIAGAFVSAGSARVWIIENEMYGNGGDSVAVNSGANGVLAHHIYVGRNKMHDEGENAVDIKQSEDVIVSQNEMWGFRPTSFAHSGSDGTAIVVNDDNISNGLDNRVWILANNIHHSTNGIRTQAYAKLIGNLISFMTNYGIVSFGSHNIHAEHNTITDIGLIGIYRFGGAITFGLTAINNIVLRVPIAVHVQTIQVSRVSNLLLPSPAKIVWGNKTYTSLSAFRAGQPTQCDGCSEGSVVYDDFYTKYQISIAGIQ